MLAQLCSPPAGQDNFWPKHAIFFIPPMTYLTALLAAWGITALIRGSQSPQGLKSRMSIGLVGPAGSVGRGLDALYSAYVVRYIRKIQTVPVLLHLQPGSTATIVGREPPDQQSVGPDDRRSSQRQSLAACIGSISWNLPDEGKERMLAIVVEIQKTRPVRSLAIWGWEPGMYVLTGIPPATRDTITERAIDPGPLRQYFQTRYVNDLRANPPDLFIDTVAKGAFMWREWTESDGYESNPQLRKFIDDNYVLVDELALVKGAKPVRFFARRTTGAVQN